jgi:hypothetical protein
MSNIPRVGSNATTAVLPEPQTSPAKTEAKSTPETAANTTVQQDPKDKVSDLKMEGQTREAQVRSQFQASNEFKMPGVDVKGPNLDDKNIQNGFKEFDKKMPSVELNWPEKGEFKSTKDKDGATVREMTDSNGTAFKEKIDKDGSRERESIDKDGNRRFELIDSKGYTLRGGADKKSSWSIDSNGAAVRTYSDPEGRQFMEARREGHVQREMMNKNGDFYKETVDQGKIERESGDSKGNRQVEVRDQKSKIWMKGFSDDKGNSYTVDSEGTSTRMHHDKQTGKMYSEASYKDGARNRQIADPNGETKTEFIDANGKRTVSTFKQENGTVTKQ